MTGINGPGGFLPPIGSAQADIRQAAEIRRNRDLNTTPSLDLRDQQQRGQAADARQRAFDAEAQLRAARDATGAGRAERQAGGSSGSFSSEFGGGFGGFGDPFVARRNDGVDIRLQSRPASTFLAQVIGQEDRPQGEPAQARDAANLYRRTQNAVDDAIERANRRGSGVTEPAPLAPPGSVLQNVGDLT